MNSPIFVHRHPGERFVEHLTWCSRIITDPGNSSALQAMPSERPDILVGAERALLAFLNALDNSGSNPNLNGVILDLNERLKAFFRAGAACFVETGSSGANIRMGIALARHLSPVGRPKILIDRFAHASVVGACTVARCDVYFVYRRFLREHDVTVPLSADDIEAALKNVGAHVVWITAPTYDGFVPDLHAIKAVCDKFGALFIVDSAWGAVHGLLDAEDLPESAISCGADASVISLHKKGIGLSQASTALFNNLELARSFRLVGDLGLTTTSPLYLLPASVQAALSELDSGDGRRAWRDAITAADEFCAEIDGYRGCRVVRSADLGESIKRDPCHVLVNVRATRRSGLRIVRQMNRSTKDLEMGTRDSVLLLFGPAHVGCSSTIARELKEAIDSLEELAPSTDLIAPSEPAERTMLLGDAFMARSEQVLLEDAVGRTAAQCIGAYPPGQAVICFGEKISQQVVNYLLAVEREGGRIKGASGSLRDTPIDVVA